jgi:hypothetical protein
MTTNNTPRFEELHKLYCSLTLREISFDMPTLYRWEQWASRGWGASDLHLVIAFIKRKISSGDRKVESLRLHNLIDVARFEDDLVDARAWQRKPKETPRGRVLKQSGRTGEPPERPVDTARTALERTKLAEKLKKWKEENL